MVPDYEGPPPTKDKNPMAFGQQELLLILLLTCRRSNCLGGEPKLMKDF